MNMHAHKHTVLGIYSPAQNGKLSDRVNAIFGWISLWELHKKCPSILSHQHFRALTKGELGNSMFTLIANLLDWEISNASVRAFPPKIVYEELAEKSSWTFGSVESRSEAHSGYKGEKDTSQWHRVLCTLFLGDDNL